jgi:hypothetical protein
MNRGPRYVLALLAGGGFAGLVALSNGPSAFVAGSFVLYAFAFGILLRYPDAVYAQRDGSAPGDALWLLTAICGLAVVGLPVFTGHSEVPEAPMSIFASGFFLLALSLGYWAADADI